MSLLPCTRFGPYEILAVLGAGGMGEVYRARDTRLHRDVAIKVLPELFAKDSDRLARFTREAQTLASLNHPNIAQIHGLEEFGPVRGLVMELVEGEDLAQRLARGSIPIDEVLPIAKQIADALAAAHEQGIVHRDLKPANIKVRSDGTVRVLDFGLAKALEPSGTSGTALSQSPTIISPAITGVGVLLGTAAYMSPEQARGKTVDTRSDIWAFGAVVYEMLTGTRPFDGENVTDTLAAVVRSEPKWDALPDTLSPGLRVVLRRCLEKNPKQRVADIRDVRLALEGAFEPDVSKGTQRAQAVDHPVWRRMLPMALIATVAVLLTGLTAWSVWPTPTSNGSRPIRFTVGPPEKGQLPPQSTAPALSLSVSPDGTMVTFSATDAVGTSALWIRNLGNTAATLLAGTEGASWPFWSPDNRFVGFFAGGRLLKIAVSGGPAQTVAEAEVNDFGFGSWSSTGVILFSNGPGPLYRVSDTGGTVTRATELDTAVSELQHSMPHFLPDGEHYLFLARSSNPQHTAVYVGALSAKERKRVLLASSAAVYVPPGYVLFHRDGTLMGQPFDVASLGITGEAVPVADGVQFNAVTRAAAFAASQTGALAYRTASRTPPRTLVWVSRSGTEQPLAAPPRGYQQPRISPDGQRIAVQIEERESQIWVYDTRLETLTRLTFEGSQNEVAIWTPDGKRLTYYSNQTGGPFNLFWQSIDGSSRPERLTTSTTNHVPMSWSADGRRLAFTEAVAPERDIWVLEMTERKPVPFIKTSFTEGGAQFSPNGRWIAYVSNESGRAEVYVQPYPGPGGKWQISTDGGSEPMWNRNGRELFYRSGDRMMAVPVSTQEAFSSGRSQMLFERRYASVQLPQTFQYYDVAPDGQRFLMVKDGEGSSSGTPINVVLNWFGDQ